MELKADNITEVTKAQRVTEPQYTCCW